MAAPWAGSSCRTARIWQRPSSRSAAGVTFTAFIGYEWTSLAKGNNLHRNGIFRDNGDKADQLVPYTTMKPLGSDNPRDLWKWMHACEDKTGGDAVSSRRPRGCEGTNSTRAP